MGTRKAIHSLRRQRGNSFLILLLILLWVIVLATPSRSSKERELELACTPTGEYAVREDQGEKETTAPLLKKVQKYNCTDRRVRWYPVEEPK